RERSGLFALDSAGGRPCAYSWIGFEPESLPGDRVGLDELREGLGTWKVRGSIPGPFQGGFLGVLSYDLGVHGEGLDLPEEPWSMPKILGGMYTRFLVFDHHAERVFLVLPRGPRVDQEIAQVRADLDCPGRISPFQVSDLRRHTPREVHEQRIETSRREIAAGEYYQVNLAHRFTADCEGHPLDLYLRLRKANAAPYCGFVAFEGGCVLSTSPELLLDFDGKQVFTRPIKGTAPRFEDPEADRASREGLLASEKDRAELAMIVDLERNDLGRIAQVGSVHVDQFPELETYARVHHLVATVRALPKPGIDAIDLIQALFPGGSITGAPKLASMEAIARLEGEGRGYFTGSMGFLGFDGRAAFNILIRTVIWRPTAVNAGEISFRVGGGITHASIASLEDQETLQKAAGLIDAWT
ncbi:MAG: anthranilate synthase component I family protein, partial [Planctomycetes bacterium]|nr:anthranilate synthase component I family protein [Planctomycetota bacterium]